MIKFVFLDIDDTLLDFHMAESLAIADTFREIGIEPSQKIIERYSKINRAHWERLERGELTREQVLLGRFNSLFAELGVIASAEQAQAIYEERLSEKHPFMENGQWLLDELYGKYKLYAASNGTARVQDRRIRESGIEKYFDNIFISQRIGCNKPDAMFFERCFAQIEGFKKDEAIMIGDSPTSDILGGINAGIKTCFFHCRPRDNPDNIKADFEIKSLKELPDLLEKL